VCPQCRPLLSPIFEIVEARLRDRVYTEPPADLKAIPLLRPVE